MLGEVDANVSPADCLTGCIGVLCKTTSHRIIASGPPSSNLNYSSDQVINKTRNTFLDDKNPTGRQAGFIEWMKRVPKLLPQLVVNTRRRYRGIFSKRVLMFHWRARP